MKRLPRLPPALCSPLHRIPVRWSLYRPLLKSSKDHERLQLPVEHAQALTSYIRSRFKQGRHLRGLDKVRKHLVEAEQLLKQFDAATEISLQADRIRALAAHLFARESLRPSRPARPSPAAAEGPVNESTRKPRVSPSIMHATQFYHPIPRLRPQPIEISMTVFNRRRTSQRRFDKLEQASEYIRLAQSEEAFEADVAKRKGGATRRPNSDRMGDEWRVWRKDAREREMREVARSQLRIPDGLRDKAREANRRREQRRAEVAATRRHSAR